MTNFYMNFYNDAGGVAVTRVLISSVLLHPMSTHPFPGKIVRESRPYAGNSQPHNTGILMSGTGSWKGKNCKKLALFKV